MKSVPCTNKVKTATSSKKMGGKMSYGSKKK